MDHFAAFALVLCVEVWNLERSDGVERQDQRFIGRTASPLFSEVFTDPPQRAKNLRPIEPLTLTVFAEIRHQRYLRVVFLASS
jgi:hypothetical protein